jgi:hypothetical protein
MQRFVGLALCAAAVVGCAVDRPPTVNGQHIDDVPPIDIPILFGSDASWDGAPPPRSVNPYPRYDVTYVLAQNDPEQSFTFDVEPRAGRLDVHFSVDTTGSFGGEIQTLKANLQDTLIPRLRERVTDLAIGVSRFADFPVRPYGLANDRPYDLLTPVTTDFFRVATAVFNLDRPLQNGGDVPEASIEALYQIATGAGLLGPINGNIDRFTPQPDVQGSGNVGGVGFRAGSARVVVNVTDAPSHDPIDYGTMVPGTHTLDQAAAAMRAINARMIGIASGEAARPQLEALATATGAVVLPVGGRCVTGIGGLSRPAVSGTCPLVFDIGSDGSGLTFTVLDAITRFLDSLAFGTVAGSTEGDTRGFITSIEALSAVVPDGADPPRREDRAPAGAPDGVLDTFASVTTRTRLTFRVHVRNTRVASLEQPQLFFVRVVFTGDDVVLGDRVVRIIVPEGPKPDSAVDVSRDRASVDVADEATTRDAQALDDAGDAASDVPEIDATVDPDASP